MTFTSTIHVFWSARWYGGGLVKIEELVNDVKGDLEIRCCIQEFPGEVAREVTVQTIRHHGKKIGLWTNSPCSWLSDEGRSRSVPVVWIYPSRISCFISSLFPSLFSCHHRLLITNNNRHVWSICCWTNIKWVIAAKFVWRDITFSWEGELEAESVQRLSQQMLSGSPALVVLPRCPHVPIPAHLLCLVAFQPPPLYPALYPPLCPTLALLNPLAVVHIHTHTHTHTHTHCSVM